MFLFSSENPLKIPRRPEDFSTKEVKAFIEETGGVVKQIGEQGVRELMADMEETLNNSLYQQGKAREVANDRPRKN